MEVSKISVQISLNLWWAPRWI